MNFWYECQAKLFNSLLRIKRNKNNKEIHSSYFKPTSISTSWQLKTIAYIVSGKRDRNQYQIITSSY